MRTQKSMVTYFGEFVATTVAPYIQESNSKLVRVKISLQLHTPPSLQGGGQAARPAGRKAHHGASESRGTTGVPTRPHRHGSQSEPQPSQKGSSKYKSPGFWYRPNVKPPALFQQGDVFFRPKLSMSQLGWNSCETNWSGVWKGTFWELGGWLIIEKTALRNLVSSAESYNWDNLQINVAHSFYLLSSSWKLNSL